MNPTDRPIEQELRHKLQAAFAPSHLELVNESHMHAAPPGSREPRESHFKVVLVADALAGKRLVQQHQAVYHCLGETMGKVHALALHTYTPAEWAIRNGAPDSPACRGGSKHSHADTNAQH